MHRNHTYTYTLGLNMGLEGRRAKYTHKKKEDMRKLAKRCGPPSGLQEEDLKH